MHDSFLRLQASQHVEVQTAFKQLTAFFLGRTAPHLLATAGKAARSQNLTKKTSGGRPSIFAT